MKLRITSFEDDMAGLRTLSSIWEEGDSGFIIVGDDEESVRTQTERLFTNCTSVDFDVVHDSVTWRWVGVVVT